MMDHGTNLNDKSKYEKNMTEHLFLKTVHLILLGLVAQ